VAGAARWEDRRPAMADPRHPPTHLAVEYHPNEEATIFLPPCSARSALRAGSRTDCDTPYADRNASNCHGELTNARANDTTLRRAVATVKLRLRPNRSAIAPINGLNAIATTRLIEERIPISESFIPR